MIGGVLENISNDELLYHIDKAMLDMSHDERALIEELIGRFRRVDSQLTEEILKGEEKYWNERDRDDLEEEERRPRDEEDRNATL